MPWFVLFFGPVVHCLAFSLQTLVLLHPITLKLIMGILPFGCNLHFLYNHRTTSTVNLPALYMDYSVDVNFPLQARSNVRWIICSRSIHVHAFCDINNSPRIPSHWNDQNEVAGYKMLGRWHDFKKNVILSFSLNTKDGGLDTKG